MIDFELGLQNYYCYS